ncbi:MAG: FtsX-like permease family protein [Actinomycetota bacterium]|nr:FtsX-like permease family protein [Actinomycetota bacterium]
MGSYFAILFGAAALISAAVTFSALRRSALRRMGLRNLTRRKWNTVLVVLGSMVGTALISGSLVLNDSTGRFQETEARQTLGEIDEVVQQAGQRVPSDRRPIPPFDASVVAGITPEAVRDASSSEPGEEPAGIDSVLGVLAGEVPAESLDDAGETVVATPAISVVGVDSWEELRSFGEKPPFVADLSEPRSGDLYASESLAKALEIDEGSKVRLMGREGPEEFTVAAVVPEDGISGYKTRFSSAPGTVLVSTKDARSLLGVGEGQINAVFISNEGDVISGVDDSDRVTEAVERILAQEGGSELQVSQVKKDAIEGSGFQIGDIFLMISSFAILAGILLIINIYTMLAEERKGELGILRAVALKRSGLVRLFVYEGYAYSILASFLGTLVGLGVAAGLVWGLNRATGILAELFNRNLTIPFHVEPASLVIAASSGLLITFLAVFFTSLRISNLNVVAAIRDLPEGKNPHRSWLRLSLQALLLLVGGILSVAGFALENGYLMLLAPVLAAFGLGALFQRLLSVRILWSLVGAGTLTYAYFANRFDAVSRANQDSPVMFFIEGVLIVFGAVLIAAFNLGLIYGVLRYLMRLVPALGPVLKMAIAHPASRPARTGFTLAMFALILYMVTISSIFSSTQTAASESTRDEQLSGYDGFVQFSPQAEVGDFDAKVEANEVLRSSVTEADGILAGGVELPDYRAQNYVTSNGPPLGKAAPGANVAEYVTYVPEGFLSTTTDALEERSPEYATDREAWEALGSDPNLAILTFPYNGKGDFLARPELGAGDTLRLRDPVSGREAEKKIIGRVRDPGGFTLGVVNGVIVGGEAVGEFPGQQTQETYLLKLNENAAPVEVGRELKKEFAASGAQTYLLDDILGRTQRFTDTFVKIVQAFLAFGLVVGVAGLAVISARAVHERRREIGVLRALGFKKGMIGWQFIVESSFVALLGILLGMAAGALGGYNLFSFTIEDPNARFVFPWSQMLVIGLLVWVASLLFTIIPAVRASRIPPVEALRYEG